MHKRISYFTITMALCGCGSREVKDHKSATEADHLRRELATREMDLATTRKEANEADTAAKEVKTKLAISGNKLIAALAVAHDATSARKKAEENLMKVEAQKKETENRLTSVEAKRLAAETRAIEANKIVREIETTIKEATNNPNFNLTDESGVEVLKSILGQHPPEEFRAALKKGLKLDNSASDDQIIANVKKAFDEKKKAIQVFMENPAPETVFAMDTDDVSGSYKLESGEECIMIFNIATEVSIVPIVERNKLPKIKDFVVIPMRAGYQKVAVCKKEGVMQLHHEKGSLYRLVSLTKEGVRPLISSREEGSCDNFSEEIQDKNLFAATNQSFSSYRGEIDGIESIDFGRVTHGANRFHMGSAVQSLGAAHCMDIITGDTGNELAVLACKTALGEKTHNPLVKTGCFTETASGDLRLTFNTKE